MEILIWIWRCMGVEITLKDKLMNDLKTAMREGNVTTKNAIQMIRAAILQTEKDRQIELDDNGIMEIISKQVKQKRSAIEQFEKGGREDLVSKTRDEINIISRYLPDVPSQGQVIRKAEDIKNEKGYGKNDLGKLIKDLKGFYGVRVDGKTIADAAKVVLFGIIVIR